MSGAADVVCEGWLRKSPPEKKLRRYAWKRRWFVLRSGRLSGEPDVLQYYKNQHSRRPIGTINLNLCEQVDAGLSFTKKELESSFVFDLRTEERTWYLVAESEDDMNRWVTSICLLCGFNPTDDGTKKQRQLRSNSASASVTATRGTPTITMVTGSIPPPYDPVSVRHLEHDSSAEDDYLWLSNCQSHTRTTPKRFILNKTIWRTKDQRDSGFDLLHKQPSASVLIRAQVGSLDSGCHGEPPQPVPGRHHDFRLPEKHSLDFHLRPAAVPLSDDNRSGAHPSSAMSGYQVPRPASTPQPPPPRRPSSTPSVDSLTQAELHAAIPPPPPRPPKPPTVTLHGEIAAVFTGPGGQPRANSEPERRDEGISRGTLTRGNSVITAEYLCYINCRRSESVFIPWSQPDRATMFEFSESFNTYFFNKGMVPLGSLCSEDDDLDESYVPMSASTNEPPVAARANPGGPSDSTAELQDGNYVPMTPLTSSLPACPVAAAGDLASLGRQVPPPAHMGFRNSTMTPVIPSTPPLRRNTMHNTSVGEAEVVPPPIHRNLKPQRKGQWQLDGKLLLGSQSVEKSSSQIPAEATQKTKVKPAPLEITPVSQDWQEVPPPVRSPVTRTFTRGPSIRGSFRPSSAQSSSPSSDSDDPDDSYVTMVTCSFSQSAGEQSLRMMLHRGSEGGVSNTLVRRAEKQVEYLDLDLHTGRSTPTRQKSAGDERARGDRRRVDYVVVDPKRTKALKNTREAWHDGRMSTEKEKS
uniref:PH domain-containing protein n=1 Tax=Poecilia formosa TaxID=48698 RepID=A0A087X536_POEFO